jgi:hypothetical protein
MTFHIFECEQNDGRDVLRLTDQEFRLAGYNLLYRAWVARGKPIGQGWQVSADELIAIQTGGEESYATRRMIIDFHPSNMKRVALVELQGIFLFNWAGEIHGSVNWTPMMLRLREVSDEWTDAPMSAEKRRERMTRLEIDAYGAEFIEFLYLQGDDGGWNWAETDRRMRRFCMAKRGSIFGSIFRSDALHRLRWTHAIPTYDCVKVRSLVMMDGAPL